MSPAPIGCLVAPHEARYGRDAVCWPLSCQGRLSSGRRGSAVRSTPLRHFVRGGPTPCGPSARPPSHLRRHGSRRSCVAGCSEKYGSPIERGERSRMPIGGSARGGQGGSSRPTRSGDRSSPVSFSRAASCAPLVKLKPTMYPLCLPDARRPSRSYPTTLRPTTSSVAGRGLFQRFGP